MKRFFYTFGSFLCLLLLVSCETNETIVNNVEERDANEILVFLASKGIEAQKVVAASSGVGANTPSNLYAINITSAKAVEAMAALNKVGLPRRQGVTLLQLFAKSGLMSSTMEDTVRYQAGMAEELKNTIRKIDGVLDADVQISFPPANATPIPGVAPPKTTAAVYVKHQGVLEDPNSHLEVKIKRLLAGSVNGLDYENVSVISDRARFADISLMPDGEMIGAKALQTHVNLWGVVMTQGSLTKFRAIFFTLMILLLALFGLIGFLVYRFYPQMKSMIFKKENV
jgi:type III secretion protein J